MSFVAVSLVALVFSFVGSLPLAGPIALLVVSNGVRGRYKEALRIAIGAALAEGIYRVSGLLGVRDVPRALQTRPPDLARSHGGDSSSGLGCASSCSGSKRRRW